MKKREKSLRRRNEEEKKEEKNTVEVEGKIVTLLRGSVDILFKKSLKIEISWKNYKFNIFG